jgi:hypothetical protein
MDQARIGCCAVRWQKITPKAQKVLGGGLMHDDGAKGRILERETKARRERNKQKCEVHDRNRISTAEEEQKSR